MREGRGKDEANKEEEKGIERKTCVFLKKRKREGRNAGGVLRTVKEKRGKYI